MPKVLRQKPTKKVVKVEDIGGLADKVEKDLSKQGVRSFTNDNVIEDYLQLPSDLTNVSSRDLGRYFTTFTNQKLYVRSILWKCGAVLREINSDIDLIRTNIYATLPSKTSVKEKELALLQSSKAKELIKKYNYFQEKHSMLETYLDNLIDAITCISREITRRESDWQDSSREDNVNNKRRR